MLVAPPIHDVNEGESRSLYSPWAENLQQIEISVDTWSNVTAFLAELLPHR